jgi:hypothetical protein
LACTAEPLASICEQRGRLQAAERLGKSSRAAVPLRRNKQLCGGGATRKLKSSGCATTTSGELRFGLQLWAAGRLMTSGWATTMHKKTFEELCLGHWAMLSTNQTKQINQAITKSIC